MLGYLEICICKSLLASGAVSPAGADVGVWYFQDMISLSPAFIACITTLCACFAHDFVQPNAKMGHNGCSSLLFSIEKALKKIFANQRGAEAILLYFSCSFTYLCVRYIFVKIHLRPATWSFQTVGKPKIFSRFFESSHSKRSRDCHLAVCSISLP